MRVDFHIINEKKEGGYHYLCRLIEKIYRLEKTILIYTPSEAESRFLDHFLWAYQETRFLPHHIFEPSLPAAPILISHHEDLLPFQEVLVNLSLEIPPGYSQFSRIIELIYEDDAVKQKGRLKYRQYQDIACECHTFRA